ncbi:WS/DGAT domain-containing protein [Pseudomonas hormoni]
MFIGIGTDIADPLERLQAVRLRTQRGIPLAKDVLYELSTSLGELVPPPLRMLNGWLQNQTRLYNKFPLFNTIITNVPGVCGLQKKYVAGAEVLSIFPMVPLFDGMGLSHGITSIYDQLTLGVLADRQVIPDMDSTSAAFMKLAAQTPATPKHETATKGSKPSAAIIKGSRLAAKSPASK